MIDKHALIERFIRYVKIDTQSDDTVTDRFPSTEKQLTLSRLLVEELKELGLTDVNIDEYGYVMATLPSNTEKIFQLSVFWLMWIQLPTCRAKM